MADFRTPTLHHAVIAVAPDHLDRAVDFFTELGFLFDDFGLDDVGLRVLLDWTRGIELVTPTSEDPGNPVKNFLDRHGDGVYTLAVRTHDAPSAEQVAHRYGALTTFRQHRSGDGWQLDEIETSVLGLPITFLSTDLP
ncbi:hypothetical protein A5699_17410 [Mycobacterium sp. E802]|uniref:VOC family protein n=1 Tax=Mycobacterium sp. E802 TaxID=1834152 RepID=UPI0008009749|nr:hypothetical protein [Mycobacterium sp. E802]OBG88356.1 hypothetical protein A5699_17410 [Mycobacterium sp. E802]